MICGVRRRGKQEFVPFCDPWCQRPLAFDIPDEQIPSWSSPACSDFSVCSTQADPGVDGWAQGATSPSCGVASACAVSSMGRSPLKLSSCSICPSWLAQPELCLPLCRTHCSGSRASDTKPRTSLSRDSDSCPWSTFPHSCAVVSDPGIPQCCCDFTAAVPGSSPLVLPSEQMLESLIEALAPAECCSQHSGILQLQ